VASPRFTGVVAALVTAGLALCAADAARAADMQNGQRIYAQHCALCHGARGQAVLPIAPSFARGERLMQPDFALMVSIRAGRAAMPGFAA